MTSKPFVAYKRHFIWIHADPNEPLLKPFVSLLTANVLHRDTLSALVSPCQLATSSTATPLVTAQCLLAMHDRMWCDRKVCLRMSIVWKEVHYSIARVCIASGSDCEVADVQPATATRPRDVTTTCTKDLRFHVQSTLPGQVCHVPLYSKCTSGPGVSGVDIHCRVCNQR